MSECAETSLYGVWDTHLPEVRTENLLRLERWLVLVARQDANLQVLTDRAAVREALDKRARTR